MNNKTYEYKIVNVHEIKTITKTLNQLSKDGWELVCVAEERHYFRKEIEEKEILL